VSAPDRRQGQQHAVPRAHLALLPIVLAAWAARLIDLGTLSLIGDESYYWLWSRHPAWAYYDHPAGVAVLVRISTALGGATPFGVRWLNAAIGVGCVILTWLVGRQLLSRRAALISAVAVAIGAPYLITSRFVYTNALTLFLMLTNLLTFWWMARNGGGIARGLAFGLTLALLFNTKYSAYAYAIALAAALVLDHRDLFRRPGLWIGVAVAGLGLVPVLVWNAGHDWASLRWQLSHLAHGAGRDATLVGGAHHAWTYLTWPLILLSSIGLWRLRTPAERLLTLVALLLLVPVALSPIDSPRNLSTALVPLLLLAGTRLPTDLINLRKRAVITAFTLLLLGAALFGVGTVINLAEPSSLPQSSIVPAIRRDAAGWASLGAALKQEPCPIFALDYSIAAQIHYYAEQPAFTAWEQYRFWGIPSLQSTTIVALDYLDTQFVTQRLREAFQHVDGPERLSFTEREATKVVHIWHARDLQWDQSAFLRHFDFLRLLEEGG
jgi:4-amino-4-deoxy-L-arabinose transferase-like glycosyltransferase